MSTRGSHGWIGWSGWSVALVAALGLSVAACGPFGGARAKTAKEFVEKYSEAYRSEDAARVVAMTELASGETAEALRESVEQDIKARGFGFVAWTSTRYVSEVDRGEFLSVAVEVKGVRSSIVLLKRDGFLILTQEPSKYEGKDQR